MTTDPITRLRRRLVVGAIALAALSPMLPNALQAPTIYARTTDSLQALSEHYQDQPQTLIANPMLDQMQGR